MIDEENIQEHPTSLLVERDNGNVIAKMSGRVDLRYVENYKDELHSVIPTAKELTLDMENVDFLDSSALGMLVALKRDADKSQIKITLRSMPERVRKLLEITRLLSAFTIA